MKWWMPILSEGVSIRIVGWVKAPTRKEPFRYGPRLEFDPPSTCLICFGAKGCGWDLTGEEHKHWTPCRYCQGSTP